MGESGQPRPHSGKLLVLTITCILIVSFASSTVAAGTVPPYEDDTTDGAFLDGGTDTVESTTNTTTDAVDGTIPPTTNAVGSTNATTTTSVDATTGSLADESTDTVNTTADTVDSTVSTTTDTVDGIVQDSTDTLSSPSPSLQLVETIVDTGTDDGTPGEPAARRGDTMRPTGVTVRPAVLPSPVAAGDASAPPITTTSGVSRSHDGAVDPGPLGAGATATVSVGVVAVGATLGSGSGIEPHVRTLVRDRLDRLVRVLAPLRYSRHDGSDPLEHEDRAAINDHVAAQPGAYMAAVSEALDIHISTVRHHVKILEREGLVETAKVRGRRRVFPAHVQQQALMAALEDDATARILTTLARRGPCSGCELADSVDRCIATVSHHLSRLAADGLVVREKNGRTTVNRLPADVQAALAPEQDAPSGDASVVTPTHG